ncbi:CPBP family intramembrane metalloprotease [Streptomyces albofaciens JCM 4342]|uniref:type II CAAX endopeptidase family protein n=1 Tax=Streptomyces albofaciens TaxID=66866 RepID=UPI001238A54A|nr:type II CAAX endopeptidase family protein [Streptomyces albofaciens]KAA6222687.1 CPBP family intramembrane metalloprotease [Streptomyces albofaciens JCM 4342]
MPPAKAMTRTPATGRSPLAFVALLAVLSVPFWLVGAVFDGTGSLPTGMPVSAFQFVPPVTVAAILVFREEDGEGVRRLMKRAVSGGSTRRRAWWVTAVLLVPVLMLMTYGLMALAGRPPGGSRSPLASVPLLLAPYFLAALAEEAGWTGYPLRPVRERFGALGAGLVIGLIWAARHLVAYVQAGRSALWIADQVLGSVAVRFPMVRLVAGTGGSVLVAVVVHTTVNLAQPLLPGYPEQPAPALVHGLLATLTAAAVVLGPMPRTSPRTKPL